MAHGHPPGWESEGIYAFADSVVREGSGLANIIAQGCTANEAWVAFESEKPIAKAELNYTEDLGKWVTKDVLLDRQSSKAT